MAKIVTIFLVEEIENGFLVTHGSTRRIRHAPYSYNVGREIEHFLHEDRVEAAAAAEALRGETLPEPGFPYAASERGV